MNSSAPWLSVILCTYQGERFLPATLRSVSAQHQLDDVEIIAIDDGSTDTTMQILTSAATSLPIRILPTTRTGNWVTNTNRGLQEARGSYCCLLHQDDLWANNRLTIWRRLTHEQPEAGLLVSSAHYIDATGRRIGRWTPPLPRDRTPLPSHIVLKHLLVQNNFALPAPIFRRDLLSKTDDMDAGLWFLADWKFWGALVAQAPVVYHPHPLVSFRLHGESQTTTRSRQASHLRGQYLDVMESILMHLDRHSRDVQLAQQAAHINIAISIALAGMTHGEDHRLRSVASAIRSASPKAWLYFLRDARINQRVVARLRARLHHRRRGAA